MNDAPIILASRSPRRLELLSLLIDPGRIFVRPPASADEQGFDDCHTITAVEDRLLAIARAKRQAVRSDVASGIDAPKLAGAAILAADTTIVAESATSQFAVLGQPPREGPSRPTLRRWFEDYYFARPHLALTAVTLERADGEVAEVVVSTTVSFNRAAANWLDWYLATDEPDGKAGGYALQGLASIFVNRVEGSLTNVVGLPIAETRQLLLDLELIEASGRR